MAHTTKQAQARQVQWQLEKLQQAKGLPFRDLLSEAQIREVLERAGVEFRQRIFCPMVTLWAFLSQIVAGKEASCHKIVSRVRADRVARGQTPCSTDTSSYCQARTRLPQAVIEELTRQTGQGLHRQAPAEWRWQGRHVVLVDGSTATMEDTPKNQAAYPQRRNQKAGVGYPILRFVVLLSLAVGTTLECAIGPCRGKKTGEQSLFRDTWDALAEGDIVLADRLFDCYRDIALLRARGVDVVIGKKQSRRCDFRRGRSLGRDDHVVVWQKPKYDSTRYDSREEWEALPEQMEMREVRVVVRRQGHRPRTIIVVTTLLDAEEYAAQALTDLFAERWHCELDLRSIKRALGMHHLRCKDPEMVHKELWMYLLAYNLIRLRMAQAAAVHDRLPRRLSFTAAKDHVESFAPHQNTARSKAEYRRLEIELLQAIAASRVGDRPGRQEPRAVKKRVTKYPYLTKPRTEARKQLRA